MDAHLYRRIKLISIVAVILATVVLLIHTEHFSIELLLLSCAYIALVLVRDYILKIDLHQKIGILFIFFQLLFAFVISIISADFIAQVYILILIGEFTFHNSRNLSIVFTIVTYACCIMSIWIYKQFPPFEQIYYLMPRVIEYFAIFGMSLLAKIAFQQKSQLALDNEQMRIASIELEQKTRLQERTRISREIHDSVGHTLTSALTGLQTASHAIEKNHYPIAQEMIDRTRENILRGLDDVRSSVHLLRENIPDYQLVPELLDLIEETKKQTNVEITYEIDTWMQDLSPMVELTLYRALQEGITNGIRHGSSTFFQFQLTQIADHIRFVLSDNGVSPQQINFGFGLTAMKERVKDIGGELSIMSKAPARGVTLVITIPLKMKEEETERSESIV